MYSRRHDQTCSIRLISNLVEKMMEREAMSLPATIVVPSLAIVESGIVALGRVDGTGKA